MADSSIPYGGGEKIFTLAECTVSASYTLNFPKGVVWGNIQHLIIACESSVSIHKTVWGKEGNNLVPYLRSGDTVFPANTDTSVTLKSGNTNDHIPYRVLGVLK